MTKRITIGKKVLMTSTRSLTKKYGQYEQYKREPERIIRMKGGEIVSKRETRFGKR
jgi:hypothetical protein